MRHARRHFDFRRGRALHVVRRASKLVARRPSHAKACRLPPVARRMSCVARQSLSPVARRMPKRVACRPSRVACRPSKLVARRSSRVITCRARISPCKMTNRGAPAIASITGGGGGIRTPGGVAPTQPFQGCTIDHSDTPPQSTFVRTSGMVPGAGLEPARTHVQQILSLPRLPLRHPGGSTVLERAKGIEPSWPAWKAGTLPLSYARLTYERHKVYHFRGKSSMANLRQ